MASPSVHLTMEKAIILLKDGVSSMVNSLFSFLTARFTSLIKRTRNNEAIEKMRPSQKKEVYRNLVLKYGGCAENILVK